MVKKKKRSRLENFVISLKFFFEILKENWLGMFSFMCLILNSVLLVFFWAMGHEYQFRLYYLGGPLSTSFFVFFLFLVTLFLLPITFVRFSWIPYIICSIFQPFLFVFLIYFFYSFDTTEDSFFFSFLGLDAVRLYWPREELWVIFDSKINQLPLDKDIHLKLLQSKNNIVYGARSPEEISFRIQYTIQRHMKR